VQRRTPGLRPPVMSRAAGALQRSQVSTGGGGYEERGSGKTQPTKNTNAMMTANHSLLVMPTRFANCGLLRYRQTMRRGSRCGRPLAGIGLGRRRPGIVAQPLRGAWDSV
jgi:hypothetical protein